MPDASVRPSTDRNLLLGILALQLDFISKDELIAAMNAWVLEKSKPLSRILLERGALIDEEHALLEALVDKHLRKHGDDPQQSLATVSSVGSLREDLRQIADPDLQASLAHVSVARRAAGDLHATQSAIGTPTSAGQRFRILRQHARGGIGEVFVARDEELNREVALKQIQERRADDPDSRTRFLLEAEVTGGLEHPGIVPVYGLGTYADGRPFYAMRFIKGDSLKDAIERFHKKDRRETDPGERTLEFRKLLGRFVDVCNAIEYAHSRGVLHRDLKPGNIMLGKYGETLVVDWGLAKAVGRKDPSTNAGETTLRPSSGSGEVMTLTGSAVGTPAFMSPEQAAGRLDELGPATDVYSLGATLYCLLTGEPPFKGDDLGTLMQAVGKGDFRRPRELRADVPAPLQAICLKAMALRAENRYRSAQALAEDVEHWLADEPVAAHPEPWTVRARRWSGRHRTLTTTCTVTAVAVSGCFIVATVLLTAANEAQHRARTEAQRQGRLAAFERDEAQLARTQAEEMARRADDARQTEQRSRQESDARLARIYVSNGIRRVDNHDYLRALLWFVSALQVEHNDTSRSQLHRKRLATTLARCPALVQLWRCNNGNQLVAFSPDGLHVLTAPGRRRDPPPEGPIPDSANLWETSTGRVTATFKAPQLRSATLSPDGLRVLSEGEQAIVWDAATGNQLSPPFGPRDLCVARFSPDGAKVVTSDWHGHVQTWRAATGRPLTKPRAPIALDPVVFERTGVWFSHNGKLIAIASRGVRICDAQTLQPIGASIDGAWGALSFDPDDNRVLLIPNGNTGAQVWDVQKGKWAFPPLQHYGGIIEASFSPDGQRIVTTGADRTARVWDARTGYSVCPPMQHPFGLEGAQFSPDGHTIMTRAADGVRVWEAASGRLITPLLPGADGMFSPDGLCIALARGGTVEVWDLAGISKPSVSLDFGKVDAASLSPDGRVIVTASAGTGQLWDAASGAPFGPPLRTKSAVARALFSPDGRCVLTAGGLSAQIWDAKSARRLFPALSHSEDVDPNLNECDFSRDSCWVATCSGIRDPECCVWSAKTGMPAGPPMKHERCFANCFSWDGRQILTVGGDGSLRLRDILTGRLLFPPKKDPGTIWYAAFTDDGKNILTVGEGGAQLWDSLARRRLGTPIRGVHTGEAFMSVDGRRLLTTDGHLSSRLWDVQTGLAVSPVLNHIGQGSTPEIARNGWVVNRRPLASFSPDGRVLATGGASTEVAGESETRIWDANTGESLGPPLTHRTGVYQVSFDRESRRILAVTSDRVELWELPLVDPRSPRDMAEDIELLVGGRLDSTGTFVREDETERVRRFQAMLATTPRKADIRSSQVTSWHRQRARDCDRAGERLGAMIHVNWLIDQDPTDWRSRVDRGRLRAEVGQWRDAAKDFDTAIRLGAREVRTWYWRALVCVRAGDREGYRETCASILKHFNAESDANELNDVAWTCAIAPAAGVTTRAVALANEAVAGDPRWEHLGTLGAACYRAGDYSGAVTHLKNAIKRHGHGHAVDWLFLTMAHRRLGHVAEARRCFAEAQTRVRNQRTPGTVQYWDDVLVTDIVLREAGQILSI